MGKAVIEAGQAQRIGPGRRVVGDLFEQVPRRHIDRIADGRAADAAVEAHRAVRLGLNGKSRPGYGEAIGAGDVVRVPLGHEDGIEAGGGGGDRNLQGAAGGGPGSARAGSVRPVNLCPGLKAAAIRRTEVQRNGAERVKGPDLKSAAGDRTGIGRAGIHLPARSTGNLDKGERIASARGRRAMSMIANLDRPRPRLVRGALKLGVEISPFISTKTAVRPDQIDSGPQIRVRPDLADADRDRVTGVRGERVAVNAGPGEGATDGLAVADRARGGKRRGCADAAEERQQERKKDQSKGARPIRRVAALLCGTWRCTDPRADLCRSEPGNLGHRLPANRHCPAAHRL